MFGEIIVELNINIHITRILLNHLAIIPLERVFVDIVEKNPQENVKKNSIVALTTHLAIEKINFSFNILKLFPEMIFIIMIVIVIDKIFKYLISQLTIFLSQLNIFCHN